MTPPEMRESDPEDPMNSPAWWEHIGEPEDDEPASNVPADQEDQVHVVAKTRAEMGGVLPDAEAPEWVRKDFPSLDWEAGYETDFSKVDWLPGRFLERGQQSSLVGEGKAGKSLFVLDWAFRMVAGRSFIGDGRHEPMRVLYLDRENSLRDVITRAKALGARPGDLSGLIYKQFPQFAGGLDVPAAKAGRQLAKLAAGYRADVVILDTVSRFITGKENDADTWLQLYQAVHERLKALGIACMRLDHFGKDAERGSRGSSAKTQDVDSVWELTRLNEKAETPAAAPHLIDVLTTLKLSRTHTRSGLGEDTFTVIRRGTREKTGMWLTGRTRHELSDNGMVATIQREVDVIVDELVAAGCPRAGRDTVKTWLKKTGRQSYSNHLMADIVRELKARPE